MDFRYCLSPYCFSNQVVTSCMGLLLKRPWFTFAHTEIGGGASFALLNKGIKIWCASSSSIGTRLFERCCHSPEGFAELTQRSPGEREAIYLRFTFQRPGNLIYFPHLLVHAVLTVDTASPTVLSGWDAATTPNERVSLQTLDEYTFCVGRGKWREIFPKKGLSALRKWVFSPPTRKVRTGYKNTRIIGNSLLLFYYRHYTSKKRFPVRLKVFASRLYSLLSSVIRIKTLLVQGLLHKS